MKNTFHSLKRACYAATCAFGIFTSAQAQTTLSSFEGKFEKEFGDNNGFRNGTNVPDPTLAVGPNHILQMSNSGETGGTFSVFSKTGTALMKNSIFFSLLNPVPAGGLGDVIALYDHLADRFVMMAFTDMDDDGDKESIALAVSTTPNPTGTWNAWVYSYPYEIDYPKIGIWNDAYYISVNAKLFTEPTWTKTNVFSLLIAINRAQATSGSTTKPGSVSLNLPISMKNRSVCVVGLQGSSVAPTGTGGLFAFMQDDAWTTSTSDVDSVGLYEMDVNFGSSSASLTKLASLTATSYKSNICADDFDGFCIPTLNASLIQSTQNRVMNQPLYRNFGTHQGIVLTHIVDKGSGVSGVRWYELRKTTGSWSIFQQNTVGADSRHRFLPSIAYDAQGNIGLGYNTSSASEYVSVRYVTRKTCDALGQMSAEQVLRQSTISNDDNGQRYGDYSHMVADPNGNSFWFTAEYNTFKEVDEGVSRWSTVIANISAGSCTTTCPAPTSLSSSAVTSSAATLSWAAATGATNYTVEYKAASSGTWIVAASANATTTYNLGGLAASTLYDWRVKTNCSSGSSTYASAQFTTAASGTCSNNYEPNDSRAAATVFPVNTIIQSMISTGTDNDYFKFNNSSTAKNIRVRLTNLPADYDVELYRNGSSSVLKSSKHSGLGDEKFYYNTSTIAQYEVRVFPRTTSAFSASNCYSLSIELSNTSYSSARMDEDADAEKELETTGIYAFPVPADELLHVSYFVKQAGTATISLYTPEGEKVFTKQASSLGGKNQDEISVKFLPAGIYLLRVEQDGAQFTKKVILNH